MTSKRITLAEAASRLLEMDNLTILCHRSPDGDTMGSGHALCRALRDMGKKARVACADPLPRKMAYMAAGMEELSFEEEHVVSVDVADIALLGSLREAYEGRVELAIDHHATHRDFAAELCVIPSFGSACEIVFDLLAEMGAPLTKEIADCLYTGIATDTGCFKYAAVTPLTHRKIAALMEAGADHTAICKVMFDTKSLACFKLESEALSALETHFGGALALIRVTREMMQLGGVTEEDLDSIAALPRKIEGVQIGITVKEREGEFKVSLRTEETADAAKICSMFGGGGHIRAAGCSFTEPYEVFMPKLLAACGDELRKAGIPVD